ncbi:MAG: protoporphyrinogen oxidase, partial [Myxococcota bacterium]|nr:protoporphyrinogen oxidase [Myxococcota bacterium]
PRAGVSADVELAVVGAGAAGLAAGLEARARGLETVVLEASARPGGVMQSDRVEGHLVERGPNTIQVKGPALALLRREGLEAALVKAAPASRRRFLLRGGRLVPVPMGPAALVATPLLSTRAKLRLLAEPFVGRGDAAGESVADFVARRLGPEVVDALVGPFLTGVYAGDERRLGAEAVFPSLVELERAHGSIVRGGLARLVRGGGDAPRGLPGIWSAPDGLGGLATQMGRALGPALRTGQRVHALAKQGAGFVLEGEGPEGATTWRARRVVLAADAAATARLLRALEPEASRAIAAIPFAPVASVSLSIDPAAADHPPEGFGFLVPRGEDASVLGVLFMSNLFARRAPPGRALLTVMLGGLRRPELVEAPDEALRDAIRRDLTRTLGLRAEPTWLATSRWPRAVPQPGPDHPGRVAAVRARLAAHGPLPVAGAWVQGVGVSDTLASGVDAVRAVVAAS